MAIGPVTGREYWSYWSGNRVIRRICGRARDQLCTKGVLEVKTLSGFYSLAGSLKTLQTACNLALKRVERPLACVAVWSKAKGTGQGIPPCLSTVQKLTFI